jgi:uncharacterized membrane protein
MTLPVHILAGALALAFGYTALYAAKGGTLHRKSGLYFVGAMIVMSLTGVVIAAIRTSPVSMIAGSLTLYFVVTGLLTVRKTATPLWATVAGVIVAAAVGVLAFLAGAAAARAGRVEAAPMFIFGAMAMLGAVGDVRMIRAGSIQGPRRIVRHLWRVCFAMWVAAASFFWGPPGRVPEIINIPMLLPIPVLAPIVVMLYWIWKIRVKKTLRGLVGVSLPPMHPLQ